MTRRLRRSGLRSEEHDALMARPPTNPVPSGGQRPGWSRSSGGVGKAAGSYSACARWYVAVGGHTPVCLSAPTAAILCGRALQRGSGSGGEKPPAP